MNEKSKDYSEQSNPSVTYIYTAYITLRNGERIYAKSRGLKAFRIAVRTDKQ